VDLARNRATSCRPRDGLPQASVVNVSQISTLDRRFLIERIGALPRPLARDVDEGVKLVLGL
jgi:mRNA interferase MazF